LWWEVLKQVKKTLADDEIAVIDVGVKVRDVQEAKIEGYVLRLAKNFTARATSCQNTSARGASLIRGLGSPAATRTQRQNAFSHPSQQRFEAGNRGGSEGG